MSRRKRRSRSRRKRARDWQDEVHEALEGLDAGGLDFDVQNAIMEGIGAVRDGDAHRALQKFMKARQDAPRGVSKYLDEVTRILEDEAAPRAASRTMMDDFMQSLESMEDTLEDIERRVPVDKLPWEYEDTLDEFREDIEFAKRGNPHKSTGTFHLHVDKLEGMYGEADDLYEDLRWEIDRIANTSTGRTSGLDEAAPKAARTGSAGVLDTIEDLLDDLEREVPVRDLPRQYKAEIDEFRENLEFARKNDRDYAGTFRLQVDKLEGMHSGARGLYEDIRDEIDKLENKRASGRLCEACQHKEAVRNSGGPADLIGSQKRTARLGILTEFVDKSDIHDLKRDMNPAMKEKFGDVLMELSDRLEPEDRDVEAALGRLRNLLEKSNPRTDMVNDQVRKMSDLLGLGFY